MPKPETLPARQSPLLGTPDGYIVDYPQVRLCERRALTAIQVLSFKAKHAPAAQAISRALEVECPLRAGISHGNDNLQISWNGPNSWIITADPQHGDSAAGELLVKLQQAVGDLGAVVDQSHARCCLRLSGPKARQVMAKNTAIDLHPRAFAAGQCVLTSVAHMNASIVQLDDSPSYDLYVSRSLARCFAQALKESCHEFAER